MNDPLSKYREKRDPGRTNEPFSAEQTHTPDESPGTWAGRFVIHQHDATRMHYDLRLQIGGTLQSFAIPRGISLDVEDKHLAVHTEDHPLEYLHFEDVIPAGNYGAGAMIVWDTGGFQFLEANGEDSLKRGKLDFVLNGFKAKGRFALIATGRRKAAKGLAGTSGAAAEWLLIKKRDAHYAPGVRLAETSPRSVLSGLTVKELAQRSLLDETFNTLAFGLCDGKASPHSASSPIPRVPMVCATEGAPQKSASWLYELKLDGVRILAEKSRDHVNLHYRSGRSATRNYADIARALQKLPVGDLVLDGEIVTFDEAGRPRFGRLAPRIQARRAADIAQAEAEVPVVYMVFDILSLGTHDLRALPIEQRKEIVKKLLPGQGYVRALDHLVERGDALWSLCEQQDLEGMVAKRLGSAYVMGPRPSGHWVKMKREQDEEFVVVGFTLGDSHELKALCLGAFVGSRLVYRGRVGGGFSHKERQAVLSRLLEVGRRDSDDSPDQGDFEIDSLPKELKATPVQPELVARVRYQGFSEGGHLRAPVYLGLRDDVLPQDCTAGPHDEATWTPPAEEPGANFNLGRPAPQTSAHAPRRVQLTNREKVYWPDEGFTKGELLDYYEAVAEVMLPHLAERPVVLVRYPDGILGKSFYQWRAPEGTPDWIRTLELRAEEEQKERGSGKAAFLIDSKDALLHIANLGCIPVHVLAGREGARECCDFLTIDLDIGTRPFGDAVRLALSLKELLDELDLFGFPKTSGQRGLHVLVPLGPGVHYESAKLLCELLGRLLVGRHADIATMERRIEKRGDRVYVDTGQTGRSRTIVAPYSVRAFPGARVSTPLAWSEIHLALDPAAFTIETVPARVQAQGDAMAPLLSLRPELPRVMAKLAAWTQTQPPP